MKNLLRLLPLLALALVTLRAADDPITTALKAADDERVAATKAGDGPRLDAIFSDELRYAHSSGVVDTKASYSKALTTRSTVYETYDYQERTFIPASPEVVLMAGRVLIHSRNGEVKNYLDLNFLAVWRLEHGRWRFLAWQSSRNAPPAPAAKK